jgi:hypothetical protein
MCVEREQVIPYNKNIKESEGRTAALQAVTPDRVVRLEVVPFVYQSLF